MVKKPNSFELRQSLNEFNTGKITALELAQLQPDCACEKAATPTNAISVDEVLRFFEILSHVRFS